MSKGLSKGDFVRVATRALGDVKKVHPFVSGTDVLRVTRVSRETGRRQVFLRDERNNLYLLWENQVELVRRAAPQPQRAAR